MADAATLDIKQVAQAVVTVLAVINPVVCGSIFLTLTHELNPGQQRKAARQVALSILVILGVSALVGLKVLDAFGISLDVFKVVGGIIIAYMGFNMLGGRQTFAQAPPSPDGAGGAGTSLFPLIMFAAGPGTITAVVTMAAVHTPSSLPLTALIASVTGAGITFGALLLASQLESRVNRNTQAVVTRFMGLVVTAMGMQFLLTGFRAFMHL
jgi:multiple antibiotic resistance protein